ncbi:hypothetical protein ACS0TY_033348 [Phlomoides rotata]
MARNKHEECIMLETDSQRLFYALTKPKQGLSRFGEICEDILALSAFFTQFRVSWIRRVGNNVAHCLASFAYTYEVPYFSESIPTCCLNALEADSIT